MVGEGLTEKKKRRHFSEVGGRQGEYNVIEGKKKKKKFQGGRQVKEEYGNGFLLTLE